MMESMMTESMEHDGEHAMTESMEHDGEWRAWSMIES